MMLHHFHMGLRGAMARLLLVMVMVRPVMLLMLGIAIVRKRHPNLRSINPPCVMSRTVRLVCVSHGHCERFLLELLAPAVRVRLFLAFGVMMMVSPAVIFF